MGIPTSQNLWLIEGELFMAERAHPEDSGFQIGSIYRTNLFKRYNFAAKYTKDKDILDIPCGVGWGTSLLPAKSKIGIDISPEAIDYALSRYTDAIFKVGYMEDIYLPDNSVDVVVCLEGYEHISEITGIEFLAEAIRVLRKKGLLVLSCPIITFGRKHSGNPHHLYEPTIAEIYEILCSRFNLVKSEIFSGPDNPIMYFVGEAL